MDSSGLDSSDSWIRQTAVEKKMNIQPFPIPNTIHENESWGDSEDGSTGSTGSQHCRRLSNSDMDLTGLPTKPACKGLDTSQSHSDFVNSEMELTGTLSPTVSLVEGARSRAGSGSSSIGIDLTGFPADSSAKSPGTSHLQQPEKQDPSFGTPQFHSTPIIQSNSEIILGKEKKHLQIQVIRMETELKAERERSVVRDKMLEDVKAEREELKEVVKVEREKRDAEREKRDAERSELREAVKVEREKWDAEREEWKVEREEWKAEREEWKAEREAWKAERKELEKDWKAERKELEKQVDKERDKMDKERDKMDLERKEWQEERNKRQGDVVQAAGGKKPSGVSTPWR
ncbi:hypothetical protein D9757_010571 [Collybiopsis confluens]|uniref:Uncharacterized protein n=1 Tax=Collybiopsis confluens TaxID=2823264 RepID=A0A8H5GXY7_9AGAR|nr:hypothetical protein D9757_010571 [Collybiopsis confluens]